MAALMKMTFVESKLLARDWGLLCWGLVFPAVLLYLLGFIPGFGEADPELGGMRPDQVYTSIVLVLAFAMAGVTAIPATLATYRHQGVLRRLRTTPVGPARLLGAQLLAHLLFASVAAVLAVLVARIVLGVPAVGSLGGLLVALTLAATSLFSIGLLIGAVAPNAAAAPTVGTLVWLVLMALAGLMFPREAMADGLRRVADHSPGGAAVDAVQGAWFGGGPPLASLAVLAASTLVVSVAATALFRWE